MNIMLKCVTHNIMHEQIPSDSVVRRLNWQGVVPCPFLMTASVFRYQNECPAFLYDALLYIFHDAQIFWH